MQYMTMQEAADNFSLLAVATGAWEDDVMSPAGHEARSSTRSTPVAARDSKNKMSFAEWQEWKKTGVRPSPRPSTPSSLVASPVPAKNQRRPGRTSIPSAVNQAKGKSLPSVAGAKRPLKSTDPATSPRPEKRMRAVEPTTAPPHPLPSDLLKTSTAPLPVSATTEKLPVKPKLAKLDRYNLPPLLSPLPVDLQSGEDEPSSRTFVRASSGEVIEVDMGFTMPRKLSPDLPDVVEEELLRMQQKPHPARTVEERRRKAREPDTPGVARVSTKPKVGHPPKASRSVAAVVERSTSAKPSLIVKIHYKKRQARDVERFLRTTPRPDSTFKKLEAQRLAKSAPAIAVTSDSDTPLASLPKSSKAAKKRPSTSNLQQEQPAAKRAKIPAAIDMVKASQSLLPAFKSPALSAQSQKKLTVTPKKGDAMKSVAMRKVESSDGNACTPQAVGTSTPASSERPRANGNGNIVNGHSVTDSDLHSEEKTYLQFAVKLKRQMDGYLKTKETGVDPKSIPLNDRAVGLCTGIECLLAYQRAFHAADRRQGTRLPEPTAWESWFGLWTFLERQTRFYGNNVLWALVTQLGAISREELSKHYNEKTHAEARTFPAASSDHKKLYDKFFANSKDLHALWVLSNRNRRFINEVLGLDAERPLEMGPWTTVTDARVFALKVMGAYSHKERAGWKADVGSK